MLPILSIACVGQQIWVRVVGRGNFQCSSCLKNLVEERLVQGYRAYIIDLAACEKLDSTFMGTLTGIAQRLKTKQEGALRVINVSEGNKQLMENLGLDQLFTIQPIAGGEELPPAASECSFCQVMQTTKISKELVEETVRSAHEALVMAHRNNIPKFQNLLEIIR